MRAFKTRSFLKWAKSEGLRDNSLAEAAKEMESGLVDAYLGAGIVKKRIKRNGQGKRAGFRTIVAFQKGHRIIFIYGYPKNQRDNINDREEKALKKLAQKLLEAPEEKLNDMIVKSELFEVSHD